MSHSRLNLGFMVNSLDFFLAFEVKNRQISVSVSQMWECLKSGVWVLSVLPCSTAIQAWSKGNDQEMMKKESLPKLSKISIFSESFQKVISTRKNISGSWAYETSFLYLWCQCSTPTPWCGEESHLPPHGVYGTSLFPRARAAVRCRIPWCWRSDAYASCGLECILCRTCVFLGVVSCCPRVYVG